MSQTGYKRVTPWILVACAVGLVSGWSTGCSDTGSTESEKSIYYAPTSPEAVLRNLGLAYEHRDLDAYEQLFDTGEFTFRFAVSDIEGRDALPPIWWWQNEALAVERLFTDERITGIYLEYTFSDVEDPDPHLNPPAPNYSQLVYLTSLTLVVTRTNPATEEQEYFIVDGDRHEFYFREYPDEVVNGRPTWKIVEWRDKSLGPGNRKATRETSWGVVKWNQNPVTQADVLLEPPTSPEAVVRNLAATYEWRLFDLYEGLFDPNAFIFRFAPIDVEAPDPLPPLWDWAEEELATRNMFRAELVRSIELDLVVSDAVDPDPNQIDNPPSKSTLVYLVKIDLVITQDNPALGEEDIFIVDGDRQDFFLREYSDVPFEGQPTWKIVEWRDRSLGPGNLGRTFETTWGQLKNAYR